MVSGQAMGRRWSWLRRLAVIWACLLVATPAWAAKGRLQLDVKELSVGQTGRLMLHMVDGRPAGVPDIPSPDGLEVRYQGSATRFQMDNFSRTLLHSYEYRVTALQPGTYTFGPYEVQLADGSTVETNEVALQVKERAPEAAEAMVASAGFDRSTAYVGQVVLYSYRLVSRVPMMGAEWRLPDFEGLRQPNQGKPEERSYFVENPDGERTTTVEGAIPLIATGTGDRTQPPAIAQVRVPMGRSDLLGFRQYRTERIPAEQASLEVKPLPRPEPAGFSGLVGDFRFRAKLESRKAAVGESITWRLEVVGDGALEGWRPPSYEGVAAGLYDNDDNRNAWVQDGRYVAQGIWTRVVVPTQEGVLQLPPLEVVTFSPSRGEYVTHELVVDPLQVTPGRETAAAMESFAADLGEGLEPEQVELDFRPIYRWGPAWVMPTGLALSALSAIVALPGLLVVGGLAGERLVEWRAARRQARERPPTAGELVRRLPEDGEARLAALEGALRLALAQRSGVAVEALDRKAAIEALPDDLRERVAAASTALDRARFAEGAADPALEAEVVALVGLLEGR